MRRWRRKLNNMNNGNRKFGITNTMIILAGAALAFGLFFIDIFTPAGFVGGIPYVAVIFLSLCSSKTKHAIYFAIGTSILTVIGSFFVPPGF